MEERGGEAIILPEQKSADGLSYSASRIRELIAAGDIAGLIRHSYGYGISGVIERGAALGRKLGFPTINIPLPAGCVEPRYGVYGSIVCDGERACIALTNIGVRPTVGGTLPCCESYIIDDEPGDMYGKRVEVRLTSFIRDEQKFNSIDELKAQIARDVAGYKQNIVTMTDEDQHI
jgi:riboflavin kinase/FMN adenylyltransferase